MANLQKDNISSPTKKEPAGKQAKQKVPPEASDALKAALDAVANMDNPRKN